MARAPADVAVSSILERPPASARAPGDEEQEEEEEQSLPSSGRASWDLESSEEARVFGGVGALLPWPLGSSRASSSGLRGALRGPGRCSRASGGARGLSPWAAAEAHISTYFASRWEEAGGLGRGRSCCLGCGLSGAPLARPPTSLGLACGPGSGVAASTPSPGLSCSDRRRQR